LGTFGNQDTKAFQEAIFISVLAVDQWIPIQRLSPENKGALPYIPLQAGYKSKKKGLTHIWLYTFLLATFPFLTFVTFLMFTISKFDLPAMLFPSSLLHYSPFLYSNPSRVKEHHLDLGVCISTVSLHGQLFSFL
jgi:hypothetical protein